MTGAQLHGPGSRAPRRGAGVLSLKFRPPQLDDEPAFRDDPILGWVHQPEEPPEWHAIGGLLRLPGGRVPAGPRA